MSPDPFPSLRVGFGNETTPHRANNGCGYGRVIKTRVPARDQNRHAVLASSSFSQSTVNQGLANYQVVLEHGFCGAANKTWNNSSEGVVWMLLPRCRVLG